MQNQRRCSRFIRDVRRGEGQIPSKVIVWQIAARK